MAEKSNKIRMLTALAFCIIFFAGTIFYPHIDPYLRNVNYLVSSLFMLIIFICIVIFFIKSIRRVIKKPRQLTMPTVMPALIYTITLLLCYFLPSSESLKSGVVIGGYEKGTQNQSDIKFRKDNTFELHASAVFGYNEWFTGKYTKKGDTLFLNYTSTMPPRFGKIILKKDGMLTALDKPADTAMRFIDFKIYKDVK